MSRRACILALLVVNALIMLTEDAQAWPRRRSGRTYTSSAPSRVAPKADDTASQYPLLSRVYFSYDRANAPEVAFADKIRVFLTIRDESLKQAAEPLVAEVKLTDMSRSETTLVKWCPVSYEQVADEDYRLGKFEVTNAQDESFIQPAKVYRLFVSLHRQAKEYNKDTAVGRLAGPYYVATSGPTLLDQARQLIAMRTFKEWYCTERGWPRDGDYVMDCHAYYLWATGACTVGASRGRANLARLFGIRNPYRGGGDIPELMKKGPIHGDYVRIPGHTFMLLAYDESQNRVWTMEGNYGRSIEVAIRPVGSGWQVGHLVEEHVDAQALEALTRPVPPAQRMVMHQDRPAAETSVQ